MPANYVQQSPVVHKECAVPTSGPVYVDTWGFQFPLSITAIPGGGGDLTVAYSTSRDAVADPGNATWINWPLGTVVAAASDALLSPVAALRLTATTAAGTVEVIG